MKKTKVAKSKTHSPVIASRISQVSTRGSIIRDVANYIKSNKVEVFFVSLIILLALTLRLYRINEFLTFLGDEGRDVRIVRDLITNGNLVFIGPQTSVGNMYLGPLYYYLIAPALGLFGLSPVGPAAMNAVIGTITVFLVWLFGREWFGAKAGLLAAFFYAISPVTIIYSRSSWNPNPTPLFALICAYGIYQVWQKNNFKWLPWIGLSFASALQMHYLSLLLVPFLGIYWLLTFYSIKDKKDFKRQFLLGSLTAFIIFCLIMSPLAVFDLKHQGMNFNAFKAFFTDRQTTINLNPARSDRFLPVMNTMVTDLVLARQNFYPQIVGLVILLFLLIVFKRIQNKKPLLFVITWIFFSILGLGVYKQHVYIHYLGFMYPAAYLLLGFIFSFILSQKNILKLLGATAFVFLVYLNLHFSPVKETPNNQLKLTEDAVDLIIKESKNTPFNFALIAKQNYDESYRYFFENKSSKMTRGEDGVTEQLFVICEDGDKCQPEGSPVYQVAIFGPASISAQWNLRHLKIYQLVHKK